MTQQERAMQASPRVTWFQGKQKKPFSDTELIKVCMGDMMEAMLEGKQKKKIIRYSTTHRFLCSKSNWDSC